MMMKQLIFSLLISAATPLPTSVTTCAKHSDCPSLHDQCYFAHGQRVHVSTSKDLSTIPQGVCFNQEKMTSVSNNRLPFSMTTNDHAINFLEVDEISNMQATPGSGTFTLQASEGNSAKVQMGEKSYSIGVNKDGDFDIQLEEAPTPYLSFKADGRLSTSLLKLSANNVDAVGGFAAQVSQGDVVRQWSTVSSDIFSLEDTKDVHKGWGLETSEGSGMNLGVAKCGGATMLGGPGDGDAASGFHRGEISKTFGNLRNHSFVRISASFHFIDLWLGEFAYMKVSSGSKAAAASSASAAVVDEYVWTKSYHAASGMGNADHKHPPSGLNICGDENVVEMDFVSNVDVSIPHNMDWVKVTFGTKLPPTASSIVGGASWGLSRVDLMIKNVDESQL